jgi:signal transduction histidine kinase
MKFSNRFVIFLFFALLTVIAANFFALRYFSEKYFREYVAEVRRELPDINLDLIGAVIGAKGLDDATLEEYREILRDLSKISTGLERFSQDPRSFVSPGTPGAFGTTARDFLSDPIARSFALSAETPILSKILSFRAFGADTPEGVFAYKVLKSMFVVNFGLIALVLLVSFAFIRLSFRPLSGVIERLEGIANRRDYRPITYRSNDEFRPLIAAIDSLSENLALQEKIRSDFLSDLSHEIKTPITAVKCYLEGIEDGIIPLDEKNIRHLSEEISRLIRITDSVMRLERLEGKKSAELRLEKIDLVEALSLVRSEYAPMLSEISQKIEFGEEKRFLIRFDRDSLLQIIHNAFSNFSKYAGPKSCLSIRFRHTKTESVLSFSDDGAGVPQGEVPFLREKFYQAEKSRSPVV